MNFGYDIFVGIILAFIGAVFSKVLSNNDSQGVSNNLCNIGKIKYEDNSVIVNNYYLNNNYSGIQETNSITSEPLVIIIVFLIIILKYLEYESIIHKILAGVFFLSASVMLMDRIFIYRANLSEKLSIISIYNIISTFFASLFTLGLMYVEPFGVTRQQVYKEIHSGLVSFLINSKISIFMVFRLLGMTLLIIVVYLNVIGEAYLLSCYKAYNNTKSKIWNKVYLKTSSSCKTLSGYLWKRTVLLLLSILATTGLLSIVFVKVFGL